MNRPKSESVFDPEELSGETLRVGLRKGTKGFGFTIVGGEQSGQALQVNNIVRGGVAALDGRLKTGDTIIRLNGRNILSWTHQDIVRWLQTTRVSYLLFPLFMFNPFASFVSFSFLGQFLVAFNRILYNQNLLQFKRKLARFFQGILVN